MDFFEMMKRISRARLHGRRAWKQVSRWLRAHPRYPSLPGGIEAALEAANHLYVCRWKKKK